MWKKIAIGFLVVILVLVVVIALQPADFRVTRSAEINAKPKVIFSKIQNFNHWKDWSPWEKMDPSMKKTLSGPTEGKGTVYEWTGNSQVGKGRMEVVDVIADQKVVIKLDFIEPFAASNMTEFVITPKGEGATVTWSMSGKNNFVSKAMGLFMDMDKMIGNDFEKGLADLKKIAEAAAAAEAPAVPAPAAPTNPPAATNPAAAAPVPSPSVP